MDSRIIPLPTVKLSESGCEILRDCAIITWRGGGWETRGGSIGKNHN